MPVCAGVHCCRIHKTHLQARLLSIKTHIKTPQLHCEQQAQKTKAPMENIRRFVFLRRKPNLKIQLPPPWGGWANPCISDVKNPWNKQRRGGRLWSQRKLSSRWSCLCERPARGSDDSHFLYGRNTREALRWLFTCQIPLWGRKNKWDHTWASLHFWVWALFSPRAAPWPYFSFHALSRHFKRWMSH